MPRVIIIYHNLNDGSYYHRTVKFTYKNYKIGEKNQYNHQIVLIIPDVYLYKYKVSLLKKVLTVIICFLQRINKKIK